MSYPWKEWFDGADHEVEETEVRGTPQNFISTLRYKAKKNGQSVDVTRADGKIKFRFNATSEVSA